MFLINSSDGFSISKLPLSYIVYGAPLYTIQALGLDIIKMPFNWVAK